MKTLSEYRAARAEGAHGIFLSIQGGNALEAAPEGGKAISMADPIAQMHEGFMGDPDAPLPARQDLIEQYLLILESKPQIQDLVTSDRKRANVLLRATLSAGTATAAKAEL